MRKALAALIMAIAVGIGSVAFSQSNLSSAETRFLSDPENAKETAAYGEALFAENDILDSVVYLERARFLGYESPLLKMVLQRATKDMRATSPIRLEAGWSPAPSPDGRSVAYVTEDGMWLYTLESKHKEKVTDLARSKVKPRWNSQGLKIAVLDPKRLVIVDIAKKTSWAEKLPGLSTESSLIWAGNGDYVAFNLSGGAYLYQVSSRNLKRVYGQGATVAFSADSKSLLVQYRNTIYSISLSNGQAYPLRSIPEKASVELWSENGESGIGLSDEKSSGDRYSGNDPIFTDFRSVKAPLQLPHSYNWGLSLGADGKRFAAGECSGIIGDTFVVLWIASTDGTKHAPVDAGEIEFIPWAFSKDGTLFAYSKYEGRDWVYVVAAER